MPPSTRVPVAAPLSDILGRLDGTPRLDLEHLLFLAAGTLPDPGSGMYRRALAEALVHLRRTGSEAYRVHDHTARSRQEFAGLSPRIAARTQYASLPRGTPVRILGEPHHGIVTHTVIAVDRDENCPAPWYTVTVHALQRCRAHGADEIEPLRHRTAHRPARPRPWL
ncbi:hypothetical protein [Streptomyces sp. NBC_00690]|uniref:hypothetical protein n=1 Tax=Streptomyces sp. NBC_00690 TaxID=2975808 RepID=UPI002E29F64A|nr:hypothetical protein [Streptomyces sp. NBC_00690]